MRIIIIIDWRSVNTQFRILIQRIGVATDVLVEGCPMEARKWCHSPIGVRLCSIVRYVNSLPSTCYNSIRLPRIRSRNIDHSPAFLAFPAQKQVNLRAFRSSSSPTANEKYFIS